MRNGFTLAELLIALAILGVIATFAIPKVLNSQQDGKLNAIGKETAAALSEAYQVYRLNSTVTTATVFGDMTQYLNYVAVDSTTAMTNWSCSDGGWRSPCLILHNGGAITWGVGGFQEFGGTAVNNAVWVDLDPDGTGPAEHVAFDLYYNGAIRTRADGVPLGVANGGGALSNVADPNWFSWD